MFAEELAVDDVEELIEGLGADVVDSILGGSIGVAAIAVGYPSSSTASERGTDKMTRRVLAQESRDQRTSCRRQNVLASESDTQNSTTETTRAWALE